MHCEQSEVRLWKKIEWRVWSMKIVFKSLRIVAHPWLDNVLLLILFISNYFLIRCLLQKCFGSSLSSYVILSGPLQPDPRIMCSPHYIHFHLFYFQVFRQCFIRICPITSAYMSSILLTYPSYYFDLYDSGCKFALFLNWFLL